MVSKREDADRDLSRAVPLSENGLYTLDSDLVRRVAKALERGDFSSVRDSLTPLHKADIADLIERFPQANRHKLIIAAGELFTGDVLANIEDDVRDDLLEDLDTSKVVDAITTLDI